MKSIFSPSLIAAEAVNGCPNVKSSVSSATAPNGSLTLHVAVDEVVAESQVLRPEIICHFHSFH